MIIIEFDEWTRAKIKNYKLRVLHPKDNDKQTALSGSRENEEPGKDRRHWHELDGQQVAFRSDFRHVRGIFDGNRENSEGL